MISTKQVAAYFKRELPRFGDVAATRLVDCFPANTLHAEVKKHGVAAVFNGHVPSTHIKLVHHLFTNLVKRNSLVEWLKAKDVDAFSAYCVADWKKDAKNIISANPYLLLPFIGFKKTDKVALQYFDIVIDDERRLVALIEDVVHSVVKDGSTLISLEQLLVKLKSIGPAPQSGWLERIRALVERQIIIGRPIGGNQFLQTPGHFKMEMSVEDSLVKISRHLVADTSVSTSIMRFEQKAGFELVSEQRAAVALCARSRVAVISGGAGTGKTTVLKAIYEALPRDLGIVQVALAGKAALRMTQATGLPAKTIAALLCEQRGVLIQDSVIVIDEASMVCVYTAYQLFKIIGTSCRVFLLGDHFQLFPIGPGLVFHRLCQSDIVPRVLLTQVQRQADSTGIPSLGASVRNHILPELNSWNGEAVGVYQVPCDDNKITAESVSIFVELAEVVGVEETQIIAATKGGEGGINSINGALTGSYSNASPSFNVVDGDKVLCTKNIYDLGLYNGLTGICKGADFVAETGTVPISAMISDYIEPGFAITVHKSQGSQWTAVVVAVRKSMLLDLELIYTALTRATDLVVFVGDIDAARAAVSLGPASSMRQVGFGRV